MIRNDKEVKIGEFLFFVGFIIFMVTSLLDLTGMSYIIGSSPLEPTKINIIIKCLRYFSYIILFAKVICTTRRKRIWFFIVPLIFALFAISYYYSTNIELLFYLLLIISAENIDSKKIFKIVMYSQIIVLTTTIILSSIGILNDLVIDPGYRDRHYLGFLYTTTSADLLFFILLEYVYLSRGVLKKKAAIVFLVLSVVVYILTDTRLTFILTIASILYFGIFYKSRSKKPVSKNVSWLVVMVPSLICISSLLMYFSYSPFSIKWQAIDKLLSYRFTFSYRAIKAYGFKLFGQPIEFISQYNYVDSSYLKIALEFGIVALVIVVCIYTMIMKKALKLKKRYLIDLIILVMLLSVTQTRLFTFSYNAFPLLLYSIIDGCIETQTYRKLKTYTILTARHI